MSFICRHLHAWLSLQAQPGIGSSTSFDGTKPQPVMLDVLHCMVYGLNATHRSLWMWINDTISVWARQVFLNYHQLHYIPLPHLCIDISNYWHSQIHWKIWSTLVGLEIMIDNLQKCLLLSSSLNEFHQFGSNQSIPASKDTTHQINLFIKNISLNHYQDWAGIYAKGYKLDLIVALFFI